MGHTFGVRIDGASPRGFLRFLSLTALWAEGGGLPLCGNAYKISVTGLAFYVIWYDNHSAIGSLRSPPPIRLRRTSPRESVSHDSQVALLPYESCSLATPMQGQNKTPRNALFIDGSTVSTGYSATVEVLHRTSNWGEVRRLACPLRRFPFAAPPNCGGGKGTGFIGEPRDPRIQ